MPGGHADAVRLMASNRRGGQRNDENFCAERYPLRGVSADITWPPYSRIGRMGRRRRHADQGEAGRFPVATRLMVIQAAYSISPGEVPVLHLRQVGGGDMADAYQDAFGHAWAQAHPAK